MKFLNSDKVSATGFLVVVPDFFFGDPTNSTDPHFDRDAWLKNHTTDKGYEDAKPVIAALRSKGVSAIGAAEICWGGKVVVKLVAGSDDIQAAALLHPSRVTENYINIEVDDIPEGILKLTLENSPGRFMDNKSAGQQEEIISTHQGIKKLLNIGCLLYYYELVDLYL
ncbi:hypothetical protein Ddye_025752 [Dipteronia dyeriana]|uniref:Dienelactone hydrolase domain-containing protein n=1 Tax=Dipteronia dyeriana TaxID=168575 RepID=A0AAD9TKU1_9ROSI|nr:hypothetical protein Ddye_025752 [Dipteronia dyeriana]